MNEDDITVRQIEEDSVVELVSLADPKKCRAMSGFKVRAYNIPRGCIASYYPETNDLMPIEHVDPVSKTPSAKSIPVLVRSAAAQA